MKESVQILFFSILILIASVFAQAAEEVVNLDEVQAPPPPPAKHGGVSKALDKFHFMGRVDLTSEFSPYKPDQPNDRNEFKNYHFLVFLKVKASEKTSFFGEALSKSFYQIEYRPADFVTAQFGKIIVPFGDTRRFHHFYGGIQGYGAQGVMFPNVWAESGLNFAFDLGFVDMDLYTVNGVAPNTARTEPNFLSSSDGTRQAAGTRLNFSVINRVNAIASFYLEEWNPGAPLYLYGGDLIADYGFIPGFKPVRLSLGRAVADVRKAPLLGDYMKSGDYIELATNALSFAELRTRYGTYIDNDKVKSVKDVHNINVGVITPIDVMRLLVEYQWNFEAVNEVQNDVLRAMLSLDF